VAACLGGSATLVLAGLVGLAVWQQAPETHYDLTTEVDALAGTAVGHGFACFHLFGFWAGATVALGAARELGPMVLSVTVFEPATIGDDDWSPLEAQWRGDVASIRQAPVESRNDRFAALVLAPGEGIARGPGAPPIGGWDARRDRLEDMIEAIGFTSDDLGAVS
jgi:hypothetical protein